MYLADQLALLFFRGLAILGALFGMVALAMLVHLLLTEVFDFILRRTRDRRHRQ